MMLYIVCIYSINQGASWLITVMAANITFSPQWLQLGGLTGS